MPAIDSHGWNCKCSYEACSLTNFAAQDRDHCQLRQCAVHNELPAECIDGGVMVFNVFQFASPSVADLKKAHVMDVAGLLHWRRLSSWMAVSPILRSHISRDKYEDPLSASSDSKCQLSSQFQHRCFEDPGIYCV